MYSKITKDIKITVMPEALEDESNPTEGVFAFAYTIQIENLGSKTVQLLERHWVIHSGGQYFNEVAGPGVVGEQPVLKSGAQYNYTSGAIIQDPIGTMEGTYTMCDTEGGRFDVEIPQFDLLFPVVIH